jgi:glycosyltransferase involved in cell wall biosynthesis
MRVVFVNYGHFNSNSGGHIAHFANSLSDHGAEVVVIGNGDPTTLSDYGRQSFRAVGIPETFADFPEDVIQSLSNGDAVLHAWTPRGNVVTLVTRLVKETGVDYVVHLEDNEEILLASALKMSPHDMLAMSDAELDNLTPAHLSHPRKAAEFMSRAAGVTLIVPTLNKFCPTGRPTLLLEPGVDHNLFSPEPDASKLQALRDELYIERDATVLVYHGNIHAANVAEVFSLYTAVLILRRRGHNVVLIRAGVDYTDRLDVSYQFLKGDWVKNLGFLDRSRLIDILKLADLFVQPGTAGDFNDFRLPSKLPEFLSLGRPVLLPKSNIGLRMTDGENAILLSRGDGVEIADLIERLLADPDKMAALGQHAREFAISEFDWNRSGRKLLDFYTQIVRST